MNGNNPDRISIQDRILDCFPSGTYALHALLALLDIVESGEVGTAAVECKAQPRLLVNSGFVDRHAATPEKLLMLVMHELHHILLGHTRLFPCATAVDNLVFDAVINALLCRMFPQPEHTRFFTDYYDAKLFPACLLRPPDGWRVDGSVELPPALQNPRYGPVWSAYRSLYSVAGATYAELYDALRRLVKEEDACSVKLLGDHRRNGKSSAGGNLERRAPVLFDSVRQVVERWPQPPDPIRGRSMASLLQEQSFKPVRTASNRRLLRCLFEKVGGRDAQAGSVRSNRVDGFSAESPIPGFSRRSIVLEALGVRPLLHPRTLEIRRQCPSGHRVHVYLDVSGSMDGLIAPLYGAVLDCREFVFPTVHLFSTEVADVTIAGLRRGECRTTGGTDLRCVASHIDRHRICRAVVITDGWVGKPAGETLETLRRVRLGVALTPKSGTRTDLEDVGRFWTELRHPSGRP